MIKEKVGERIKELRTNSGFSQEELAIRCGLDRTYITYVETAKKNVTIETLFKITNSLNITLKDFFDFDINEMEAEEKVNCKNKDLNMSLEDLVAGKIYTNAEIASIFLCSPQGGMCVSRKLKTITLISQKNGKENPYNDSDSSNNSEIIYTGMGLVGDQIVSETNQNGKVAFSNSNGYTIYYFEGLAKNQYQFKGIAKLSGSYYFVNEEDANGNMRKVVKFPLHLI